MIAARPEATNATRVATAAAIPMPASSIQAGKNAPKRMKEGAPCKAHPLIEVVSSAPTATLVNLIFAKGYPPVVWIDRCAAGRVPMKYTTCG